MVLYQKRGNDGEVLLSDNLPEAVLIWLSEADFRYHDAVSAVSRHLVEVPSSQLSDSNMCSTFPTYYVDVDREADRDFTDINAGNKPSVNIMLKTRCT